MSPHTKRRSTSKDGELSEPQFASTAQKSSLPQALKVIVPAEGVPSPLQVETESLLVLEAVNKALGHE